MENRIALEDQDRVVLNSFFRSWTVRPRYTTDEEVRTFLSEPILTLQPKEEDLRKVPVHYSFVTNLNCISPWNSISPCNCILKFQSVINCTRLQRERPRTVITKPFGLRLTYSRHSFYWFEVRLNFIVWTALYLVYYVQIFLPIHNYLNEALSSIVIDNRAHHPRSLINLNTKTFQIFRTAVGVSVGRLIKHFLPPIWHTSWLFILNNVASSKLVDTSIQLNQLIL